MDDWTPTAGGESKWATCSLHQLDTTSLLWTELAKDGPAMKCGMVEHEHTLVLFGGYNIPPRPLEWSSDRWNNELHIFDLKEGE